MRAHDNQPTHTVTNQPPAQGDVDLWASDPVLRDHAIGADASLLARHGARLGRAEMAEAAWQANRAMPELRSFDAEGRRRDDVLFTPAYHDFLSLGLEAGYAAGPWTGGTHTTHAALVYLHSQVEPGTCCPMTMSYAAIPALSGQDGLGDWVRKLSVAEYDPSVAPLSSKRAATLGMAMTEKQGGSDVRANSTWAEQTSDGWRLTGHKWFCSAPMSDGFLTLAQTEAGLSCFLVPRWLEDGSRNAIHLMRLKDKLGNRANASAEIEYHGAFGIPVGEMGRGVNAILQMVHHTRLDTAMAPAGLMRAALSKAHHWVSHRSAFQRRLIDQPLMRAVLADLVLDWEGATALAFRVARAFDDPEGGPFARIAVALAKFLNNKRAVPVIAEAMEVLGGMGYVEETGMPLLYREAPLNGIWEGSGNVICLDILRTLARDPASAEALDAALQAPRGQIEGYDAALARHHDAWAQTPPTEAQARRYATDTALLLSAATLIDHAPPAIAEAFCATRLSAAPAIIPGAGAAFDADPILERLG